VRKQASPLAAHLPLVAWLLFSAFTVLAFLFGPIHYDVSNPTELYLYLLAVHIAVLFGYISGTQQAPALPRTSVDPNRLALWLGTISLVGIVISLYGDYTSGLSVSNTLTDADLARRIWREDRGGTATMYLGTFLSGANWPLLGLTFCLVRRIRG
jgi:NADH:ubiquinone oxidoreductase subunit 6 (subunit J)